MPVTDAFTRLVAPARRIMLTAWLVQGMAALVRVVPYFVLWVLACRLINGAVTAQSWWLVSIVAGAAITGFAIQLIAYAISHKADHIVARHIRREIADHVSRLPLGRFAASGGRLLDSLGSDIDELHAAVAHGRMELISSTVIPVVTVIWLGILDPLLVVILLIPTVTVYILQRQAFSGSGVRQRHVAVALVTLVDAMSQLVRDLPTLRIVGRGSGADSAVITASDAFREAQSAAYEEENRRAVRAGGIAAPVTTAVLVSLVGGISTSVGLMSITDFIAFVIGGTLVAGPLQDIAAAQSGISRAALAAQRITELLNQPPLPVADPPGRLPQGADVCLSDVTFSHGDHIALNNVSIVFPENTTTAIVGPSGAGKSTVAALIARFYDVDSGRVKIGGVNVKDMTTETLYSHVGFVLQDSVLVKASVADNIRLARPNADNAEVMKAARMAGIHDRIEELPHQYDSVIGEDARLSGGERQRMTIARLFLTDPHVLVLDEPTAHVDPDIEEGILRTLTDLGKNRTVITIVHQLSLAAQADRIVVLDRGAVTEQGNHEELLMRRGLYHRLWTAQHAEVSS